MSLQSGQSELDSVSIKLADGDKEIKIFDNYIFNQNFMLPTAGWKFTITTDDESLLDKFALGARVLIYSNGNLQCTGYIENINTSNSSDAGTKITIEGRDILGPVADASLDYKSSQIGPNMTVLDLLTKILPNYGITVFYISDADNLNIITGNNSKVAVPRKDLKTIPLDQLKGHTGEGVFELINRVLSRLGLRMWAACTHDSVIIDRPDFTSPPIHKLIRKKDQKFSFMNNIIEGSVTRNGQKQPSTLVMEGFGGQGDNSKSKLICIAYNELVAFDTQGNLKSNIKDVTADYPNALTLPIRKELLPKVDLVTKTFIQRPVYVKDDESKTIEQLANVTRKKMSFFQKEYIIAEYIVEGHTQNGHPFAVNTLISVDDDIGRLHQNMWVIEKTFEKSFGGGTITKLKLILPNTLELEA